MENNRFAKLFEKREVQPGDETTMANNPRNWLADKVNPVLDQYVNPVLPESVQLNIPKMTVADEIDFYNNLPEQMAGSAMGTMKNIGAARPGANVFGTKAPNVGKVQVIETAADKIAGAQGQAFKQGAERFGQLNDLHRARFKELYGPETVARKAELDKAVANGAKTVQQASEELGAFMSEMMAKVRRGD